MKEHNESNNDILSKKTCCDIVSNVTIKVLLTPKLDVLRIHPHTNNNIHTYQQLRFHVDMEYLYSRYTAKRNNRGNDFIV